MPRLSGLPAKLIDLLVPHWRVGQHFPAVQEVAYSQEAEVEDLQHWATACIEQLSKPLCASSADACVRQAPAVERIPIPTRSLWNSSLLPASALSVPGSLTYAMEQQPVQLGHRRADDDGCLPEEQQCYSRSYQRYIDNDQAKQIH